MENSNNVSLTISKDIVNPIVNAKIQEAIVLAMGGGEELISKVVESILNHKTDASGKVSSYASENKFSWFDATVTKQIREAAESAIKELLLTRQDQLKKEIFKQLSKKDGIEKFAAALLSATSNISEKYSSAITIEFNTKK